MNGLELMDDLVKQFDLLRGQKARLMDERKAIDEELALVNKALAGVENQLLSTMEEAGKERVDAPFGKLVRGYSQSNVLDAPKAVAMLKEQGLVDDYLGGLKLSMASLKAYPSVLHKCVHVESYPKLKVEG
jgi:hypothetical protein